MVLCVPKICLLASVAVSLLDATCLLFIQSRPRSLSSYSHLSAWMSADAYTDQPNSPTFSVIAESDLGSELSFESIEQGTQPTPCEPTTVTMSSNMQTKGLEFHPTYEAVDHMVVFQVSDT
jgi:hypothetical protein